MSVSDRDARLQKAAVRIADEISVLRAQALCGCKKGDLEYVGSNIFFHTYRCRVCGREISG